MRVINMAVRGLVVLAFASLTACGGGGGGGGASANSPGTGVTPVNNVSSITYAPPTSRTVSTMAGGTFSDGPAATAKFFSPSSIASDGINIYVADTLNHKIRKIDPTSGAVTTLAGGGGNGNVWFPNADGSGALDGIGGAASFNQPDGITTDGTNLYVADTWNNTIRKIVIATGEVTTLAGDKNWSGALDGTRTAARFSHPQGITTDGTNLYVADTGNSSIRKIVIATGVVTTVAGAVGGGALDGVGMAASFTGPRGITTDGTNLYVADSGNHKIRQIVIATGVVTTLAGGGGNGMTLMPCSAGCGTLDGTGAAASFNRPDGIATDGANLYVADSGNNSIRKIVIATAAVTTLAGGTGGSADGIGPAASFSWPTGVIVNGANLYVADTFNHKVRKIAINTAAVTTYAGNGTFGVIDGIGTSASFSGLNGDLVTDGVNLYLPDTNSHLIRKVEIATGVVSTLAGGGGGGGACFGCGALDGVGTAASFNSPRAIATDGTNLYVADIGNGSIRKIAIATGTVSTVAGTGIGGTTFSNAGGIVSDGTNLYVTDSTVIRKVVIATGVVTTVAGSSVAFGALDGTGTAATFTGLKGITTDGTNLYVADTGNGSIRKIEIATGVVTTWITGLNQPDDIDTTDGRDFYVTEYTWGTIRQISIATNGVLSVALFAGNEFVNGSMDGPAASAGFDFPQGIATDGVNVFVSQFDRIRKIY